MWALVFFIAALSAVVFDRTSISTRATMACLLSAETAFVLLIIYNFWNGDHSWWRSNVVGLAKSGRQGVTKWVNRWTARTATATHEVV